MLSRDPLVSITGSSYLYMNYNPPNGTDPTGLSLQCHHGRLGGGGRAWRSPGWMLHSECPYRWRRRRPDRLTYTPQWHDSATTPVGVRPQRGTPHTSNGFTIRRKSAQASPCAWLGSGCHVATLPRPARTGSRSRGVPVAAPRGVSASLLAQHQQRPESQRLHGTVPLRADVFR